MQAGAPGLACSKEFSSGSISSQPASRRVVGRGGAAEKSGAMNGLANWAATADLGATRRSGAAAPGSGSAVFSGSGSMPAFRCISRMIAREPEVTSASSSRSSKNEGSVAAMRARMAAMPSRRLSSASRREATDSSVRTRTRSRRASRAIAW